MLATDIPISIRLRIEILLHGKRQDEVARAAGYTPDHLSRVLTGVVPATDEFVRRVEAAILGIEVPSVTPDLIAYAQKIARAMPPLTEQQVAALRGIVRSRNATAPRVRGAVPRQEDERDGVHSSP